MDRRPSESLTIVMAAFNERDALPQCVERTLSFIRRHIDEGELIIVDDGSTDGTAGLIDEIATREPEVRAFHLPRNMGMGAALLKGFEEATGEWITILPGDGQLDAHDLLSFFEVADDADLVTSLYRSRRSSFQRKILSLGLRALTMLIVGARARSDGAYLIRKSLLDQLEPRSRGFVLNLEIPIRARRRGFRVKSVSVDVHDRIAGRSKAVAPKRILHTFLEHLALRASMESERLESIASRTVRWRR